MWAIFVLFVLVCVIGSGFVVFWLGALRWVVLYCVLSDLVLCYGFLDYVFCGFRLVYGYLRGGLYGEVGVDLLAVLLVFGCLVSVWFGCLVWLIA